MKLKRVMAFVLASMLMMSSMTVLAKDYKKGTMEAEKDKGAETGKWIFTPDGASNPDPADPFIPNDDDTYINASDETLTWKTDKDGAADWRTDDELTAILKAIEEAKGQGGSGDGDGSSEVVSVSTAPSGDTATASPVAAPKTLSNAEVVNIIARAEALALQAAARDEGFADVAAMQYAAAKNMSAGEYYNNAVVETPGIEAATPVAQGGGIIINGVVTNAMATISKVDKAFVDSVRASVEGTVLNVVDVQFPALEATINFYMPGVTADENVAAVQYAGGAWVEVEVAEVRADHVVLNLKQNGKVAFLAK
ncbi:MAG: hypothetical protein NC548_47485 [Lachnospiraceae bacterium]|nr:hypothetical protein [Lachnospiraceae bacterium]